MIAKKSHWLLCIIISLIMVIEIIPVNAYAEETISSDTTWYIGNETSTEFFIDSANKLAGLATLVNGGINFAGKTINLGADIILNYDWYNYGAWATAVPANTWIPIGSSTCNFAGTFNGNNHKVMGIYIKNNQDYQGLFGVSSGIIKNVGVINSYIKGNNFVGGIVGQNNGGTINGSFNAAIISGNNAVGGVVGQNNGGSINGSSNMAMINGNTNIGGIVGNTYLGTIQKSYNTGVVTGIGSNIGGIIGNVDMGTVILYCYNTGNICTYFEDCGGIIGKSKNSIIYYCYNTGTIQTSSSFGGGIIGYSYSSDQVCICYNVGSVFGTYVGGIIGYDGGSSLYNNNYYTGVEKACGNKDNLSGINQFLPILNTTTLKYGEEEEITGITGVNVLKQQFGSDFALSCTYQSSNTDLLSVSGNTIKAVGTATNSSDSLAYLTITSITVKQNNLTSSGFTGGWNMATYTQNNASLLINVLKADNALEIACDSFTYDGTTKPSPRIISNKSGESIDLYYFNTESGDSIPEPPTEVGNYIVKAVTNESEHYNRADTSVEFSINKIDSLMVELPNASEITVRQSLADSLLSGGSTKYGTFSWEDPTIKPKYTDSNVTKYRIVFTPNEQTKQHYQNIILSTDSIGVNVKKLVPKLEIVCNNIEIGTQVIPSIVNNTSGGRVDFQYKMVGSDDVTYKSVAPNQPGSYTVKAYLEETEEYLSTTVTVNFTIRKIDNVIKIACDNVTYGTPVNPKILLNKSGGAVKFVYSIYDSKTSKFKVLNAKPTNTGVYMVEAYSPETEQYNQAYNKTTFTILRKSVSVLNATLSASSYTYNGGAMKPVVTLKDGTTTLINGTDYTIAYTGNIYAGTGTVIINGIGNYSETLNKTFTILRKSISAMTGTLSATSYTYTGGAMKPTVTVKNGATTLKSGTDYTVTYTGNISVGTGKVTIAGKGNYSGTIIKTFTIKPTKVKVTVIAGTKSATVGWTKASGITGYVVYMSTSKNGTYTAIKDASSTTTNYKKTSLTKGKTYYFKVRSYKKTGTSYIYGDYSSIVSVIVK